MANYDDIHVLFPAAAMPPMAIKTVDAAVKWTGRAGIGALQLPAEHAFG
jgi:hypothetical protein